MPRAIRSALTRDHGTANTNEIRSQLEAEGVAENGTRLSGGVRSAPRSDQHATRDAGHPRGPTGKAKLDHVTAAARGRHLPGREEVLASTEPVTASGICVRGAAGELQPQPLRRARRDSRRQKASRPARDARPHGELLAPRYSPGGLCVLGRAPNKRLISSSEESEP
jgi:hypothetical protein